MNPTDRGRHDKAGDELDALGLVGPHAVLFGSLGKTCVGGDKPAFTPESAVHADANQTRLGFRGKYLFGGKVSSGLKIAVVLDPALDILKILDPPILHQTRLGFTLMAIQADILLNDALAAFFSGTLEHMKAVIGAGGIIKRLHDEPEKRKGVGCDRR